MKKDSSFYIGLVVLVMGLLMLISTMGWFHLRVWELWPSIFWIIGLSFQISFFSGKTKEAGVLVPGGIMITIAIIFSICTIFGWHWMSRLWPLFILAPAVGLFQLYIFGNRERGLLIPVGILGVIGGIFLANNMLAFPYMRFVIPAVLVVLGIWMMTASNEPRDNNDEHIL